MGGELGLSVRNRVPDFFMEWLTEPRAKAPLERVGVVSEAFQLRSFPPAAAVLKLEATPAKSASSSGSAPAGAVNPSPLPVRSPSESAGS